MTKIPGLRAMYTYGSNLFRRRFQMCPDVCDLTVSNLELFAVTERYVWDKFN